MTRLHQVTPLLALLLMVPLASAGPVDAPPPAPVAAPHQVSDGVKTLQDPDLMGQGVLRGEASHTFTVTLEPRAAQDAVQVELHFAVAPEIPTSSSPPIPMAFQGTDAAGNALYEAAIPAGSLAQAGGEATVRFLIVTKYLASTYIDRPGSGYYEYIADDKAPLISSLELNGEANLAIHPDAPLEANAVVQDAAGIATATLRFTSDSATYTRSLTCGEFECGANFPSGIGLPRGSYLVSATAEDTLGHAVMAGALAELRVAPGPPQPLGGDAAVQVTDGSLQLQVPQLDGTGALPGAVPHTFRFTTQPGLPGEEVSVTLRYTLDGTPPLAASPSRTFARVAASPAAWTYDVTLPSTAFADAEREHAVRFILTSTSTDFGSQTFPETGSYAYIRDEAAPHIGDLTLNGRNPLGLASHEALDARVELEDAAGIHSVTLRFSDGVTTLTQSLTAVDTGVFGATMPEGTGLPAGVYVVSVMARDALGHTATRGNAGELRVGDGAPAAVPGDHAVTVSDDATTLTIPLLDGLGILAGERTHRLRFETQPGLSGEAVTVRAHYTWDGSKPTSASPHVDVPRTSQTASSWVYERSFPASAFAFAPGEHHVRFLLVSSSSYFGEDILPEDGAFSYLRDAEAPRITDATLNGQASQRLASWMPATVRVQVIDAAPIAYVRVEILDAMETVVRAQAMLPAGDAFEYREDQGIALPEGTYSLRFTAGDVAGHDRAPVRYAGMLVVDDTAPSVADVLVNGARQVVSRADATLRIVAHVDDQDAGEVLIEILDDAGAVVRQWLLEESAPGEWTTQATMGPGHPDGAYSFRVVAQDELGNLRSEELPYAPLTLDSTPPTIRVHAVDYPAGKEAARLGDEIHLTYVIEDEHRVMGTQYGAAPPLSGLRRVGSTTTFEGILVAGSSTGPMNILVEAHDEAGNQAQASHIVMVDNEAPAVENVHVVYPGNQAYASRGDRITFRVDAADADTEIARVVVDATALRGQQAFLECFRAVGDTTWQAEAFIAAEPGDYQLAARAQDAAGNTFVTNFTVQVRAPGATVLDYLMDGQGNLNLAASRTILFSATFAEAVLVQGADFLLTRDGAVVKSIRLNATGPSTYSATLDPRLATGRYDATILVTFTDDTHREARNPTRFLVIDAQAPLIRAFRIMGAEGPDGVPTVFFGDEALLQATIEDLSAFHAQLVAVSPTRAIETLVVSQHAQDLEARGKFLENGLHEARLTVTDVHGAAAQARLTFRVVPHGGGSAPGPVRNLHLVSASTEDRIGFSWEPPEGVAVAGYAFALDEPIVSRVASTEPQWSTAAPASGPHVFRVMAVSPGGYWGPVRTLEFRIENGARDDPEDDIDSPETPPGGNQTTESSEPPPSGVPVPLPILIADGFISYERGVPDVAWHVTGPPASTQAVSCIEVHAAQSTETSRLAGCSPTSPSRALHSLALANGSTVTVQLRLRMTDGRAFDFVAAGSFVVDRDPPTIHDVAASLRDGNATFTMAGSDIAEAFLLVERNGTTTRYTFKAGSEGRLQAVFPAFQVQGARLAVQVTDAAGNSATKPIENPVDRDPSIKQNGGGGLPGWVKVLVWLTIALGIAACGWLLAKRLVHRAPRTRKPPPSAPPKKAQILFDAPESTAETKSRNRSPARKPKEPGRQAKVPSWTLPAGDLSKGEPVGDEVESVPTPTVSRRRPLAAASRAPVGGTGKIPLELS